MPKQRKFTSELNMLFLRLIKDKLTWIVTILASEITSMFAGDIFTPSIIDDNYIFYGTVNRNDGVSKIF